MILAHWHTRSSKDKSAHWILSVCLLANLKSAFKNYQDISYCPRTALELSYSPRTHLCKNFCANLDGDAAGVGAGPEQTGGCFFVFQLLTLWDVSLHPRKQKKKMKMSKKFHKGFCQYAKIFYCLQSPWLHSILLSLRNWQHLQKLERRQERSIDALLSMFDCMSEFCFSLETCSQQDAQGLGNGLCFISMIFFQRENMLGCQAIRKSAVIYCHTKSHIDNLHCPPTRSIYLLLLLI